MLWLGVLWSLVKKFRTEADILKIFSSNNYRSFFIICIYLGWGSVGLVLKSVDNLEK